MGLYDRDYYKEEGGGWRGAFRRMFVEGDSPLNWALPLFTAWGIRVRIHIIFIIMIVLAVVYELFGSGSVAAAAERGGAYLLLFACVLLHEFGHCFACRKVGGEADEILMWPLGGLAYCRPPHTWRAAFITTAGGPAVNVLLLLVSVTVLIVVAAPGEAIFFDLFNPFGARTTILWLTQSPSTLITYARIFLFYFHVMNFFLLAFNVLLPMFPMDGGRLLQEGLWAKLGYERSMIIATNVGLFAAVAVGLLALVSKSMLLLGVAIFAGITCWQERQRITFLRAEGFGLAAADPRYASAPAQHEPRPRRPSKSEERRRKRAVEQQQEIDRILAKISEHGIQSLSRAEKKALARASEEKKKG